MASSDVIFAQINALPFDDNSVQVLYASHVLEHVSYNYDLHNERPVLFETLKEWKRVLKPNGILYVAVPDANFNQKKY